jgi:hypothetical protein
VASRTDSSSSIIEIVGDILAVDDPSSAAPTEEARAIQVGVAGAAVLLAMWIAHYFLFHTAGWTWVGTVVVVENVISWLAHSDLFDFAHGWLYVFSVGVVGGMMLQLHRRG